MQRKTVFACLLALSFGAGASAQMAAERVAYDYTALYKALNPSIVKIHSDFGTGSGFLVTTDGLVATNHHVVRNSRYLAVELADGRKVAADCVVLDPKHDLAILKVNRTIVEGLMPLPLLPADQDGTVEAGIPAVAIGSPLSQTFLMTQGIVSKVEPAVLLGDFLIQPGNSGGPLVSLAGVVIGINTFAEGRISGAVRVNVLRDVLARPDVTGYAGPEPEPILLPMPDRERYPADNLKERIVREPLDATVYRLDGGKFTLTAVTPVLVGKSQVQTDLQQAANRYNRRAKKIRDEKYDPVDEPFYDWLRNAAGYMDAVVSIEVKPDFGQTAGSAWGSVLGAVAAGLSKTAYVPGRQTMEFKAEFQDLRLYRDGQLMPPITPGRQITEQTINNPWMTFVDEAYSGWYTYHPSVFMTGQSFRFDIYDAREPGRVHKSVAVAATSKFIQQIRRDFEGIASTGR